MKGEFVKLVKGLVLSLPAVFWMMQCEAGAQDEKVYAEGFDLPVFERVDANGVDLITGSLQISSPSFGSGTPEAPEILGLLWSGKSWVHLDVPTIWRSDGTFTVLYQGSSQEFRGRSNNYAEKKPINGTKLECESWSPGTLVSWCIYTHRNGDVVLFSGLPSPNMSTVPKYGLSALKFGNLGIHSVRVISAGARERVWGQGATAGFLVETDYFKQTKFLNFGIGTQQSSFSIKVVTANHANDDDEHYMRPKNTTQTFTDILGQSWVYTFDNNRRMTGITPPNGLSPVTITYYDSGKVKTVVNADGTWNYSYTTPGEMGTTTVINPIGETTWVRYHRDKGYITNYRDGLSRETVYSYDSGDRLIQVTYPEQNRVVFGYDARGNVIFRITHSKQGADHITETAAFPVTCSSAVTCNLPMYIIDANGGRTDFEYEAPTVRTIFPRPQLSRTITVGSTRPARIWAPAPTPGAARPEVINEYNSGVLVKSTVCRTQGNCVGTGDAVVTTFDYGDSHATARTLFGMTTSADGQSLTTCYTYDRLGRRQSETSPVAGNAPCPRTEVFALSPGANPVVAPYPLSAPTYPDGSAGTAPPPPPPPPPDDEFPSDNCGPGTGIICP
jgi:hypothetical protein